MNDPKKGAGQGETQLTAHMPQKNAVSPLASVASEHEERLIDEALEETFPASDPVEEHSSEQTPERLRADAAVYEHEEGLLDEALEETFPASDPIAVYGPEQRVRSAAVFRPER
ncbi:MAG TPA: hypothetical protein VM571_07100 [Noviherbaspirillum sp.]|nr:hypothetical protein [Noviherbaspirillum sp.]